ncbi:hypothetical protein CKM354_000892400 [Cercospora kikuchii]|uniref:Aminoglycoside phosphotransferase domain-containing protein n=1 Tax=Cercospora kikuchii TaxID=84275 RepID=A0A9P3CNN1_9PEZI|nr:uncharacterized protein CKM354_000892400 [Cercospora kikuchii]GIZ45771.1 hypothetical protein CKM354_000892400 [Cercospora kikuchii]
MEEAQIPSLEKILQSTNFLSAPDASAKVVQVGDHFAVKYGRSVDLLEAQNLSYVATHSNVPVPKLYGTLFEESTNRKFIIMEMIKGQTLAQAWPDLTPTEKRDVVGQILEALFELRKIPSVGYIGSVDKQACVDGIFYSPRKVHNPSLFGPFETEEDMNQGILRMLEYTEPASCVALLRTLFAATLKTTRSLTFTHGDPQPKNIIVEKAEAAADGEPSLKIKIIDWEISGWYPEYWEFCNATLACRFKPDRLETVQSVVTTYPQEYLMMQVVRELFLS